VQILQRVAGRTLFTWRDISASDASNFEPAALRRCCTLRLPETCSEEVPGEFGRLSMGREGPTADTAVIAVNTPNTPIAKIREAIRGLPKLAW